MLRHSLSPILFGLVFAGFGILFLVIFGQGATLRCSRPEPSQITCQRETRWLNRLSTGSETIAGMSQAYVTESCDDGCTYRVELDTVQGPVALTSYYTSGYDDKADVAQKINEFLSDPDAPPMEVNSDAGLLAVLLPVFFIVVGGLFIITHLVKLLRLLLAG